MAKIGSDALNASAQVHPIDIDAGFHRVSLLTLDSAMTLKYMTAQTTAVRPVGINAQKRLDACEAAAWPTNSTTAQANTKAAVFRPIH
jgi:hypothetical protein